MAKPTLLPEWDQTETNAIEPDAAHKAEGWLAPGGVPEKPPFQTFNYWQNLVYKWVAWLVQLVLPLGNISSLKSISYIPGHGDIIATTGYNTRGDHGGDTFYWDNASTLSDNGINIIELDSAPATGRFISLSYGQFNALGAGAYNDGTHATETRLALQSILDINGTGVSSTGGILFLPAGTYLIDRALQIQRGWSIIGEGRISTKIKRTDTTTETLDGVSTTCILYISDTWINVFDIAIESDDSAVDGIIFSHAGPASHLNFARIDINHLQQAFGETQGLFLSAFANVNVSSGVSGFIFDSNNPKTSLTFRNCYTSALTGQPYSFVQTVYSSLISCASDQDNSANQATELGVYNFFVCTMTLTDCGTEGSYGNGSIRSASSSITINGGNSMGGRSTFVPDYGTYPNHGVGPIQTDITFNNININGYHISDWQNTSGSITGPTSDLVSFNYDGVAYDFNMVTVGAINIPPTNMFAGHGSEIKYCKAIMGPVAFSAYDSTGGGLTTAVFTKIIADTEEFDTRANFSSATFTPDIEGYYSICGAIQFDGTITRAFSTLYKNGAEFKRGNDAAAGAMNQSVATSIIYMNGTTDYIELYGYAVGSGLSVIAGQAFTFINGALIK